MNYGITFSDHIVSLIKQYGKHFSKKRLLTNEHSVRIITLSSDQKYETLYVEMDTHKVYHMEVSDKFEGMVLVYDGSSNAPFMMAEEAFHAKFMAKRFRYTEAYLEKEANWKATREAEEERAALLYERLLEDMESSRSEKAPWYLRWFGLA